MSDTDFQVTNLKVGDVCFFPTKEHATQDATGWVCHERSEVLITNNGTCNFDGTQHGCTWYGYSFDYENAGLNQELRCQVTDTKPADYGNPSGTEKKNSSIFEYNIPLDEGAGHYFNPQYSVFTTVDDSDSVVESETVCSANGVEAFRFTQNLHYPGNPG